MNALHVVVLAAGKSTRMKSARPKVLHDLAGLPLVAHVLRTAAALSPESMTLVTGYGSEVVASSLRAQWPTLEFALQSPQLGTGHALLQAEASLTGATGTLLLLYGDVPLLTAGTLSRLLDVHRSTRAAATVLTTTLPDPYGYGRIVRDGSRRITRIVEERDASAGERAIREINSGIYAFELAGLFAALHALANDNAQGEYYLTDLVDAFTRSGRVVETVCLDDADELRGVNTRVDLAALVAIVRARKNRAVMLDGVTLDDPATTSIDEDVTIGSDTEIGPSVQLEGRTSVGARCRIHAGVRLTNAVIGDDVTVRDHSVIVDSIVGTGCAIGPFAHLRPDSRLGRNVHIGNFVELKKTTMGDRSKANHLAYLGDATIGEDVNIGAGTITCNYDGIHKHPTVIEDGVFIGSDSQLIAPVKIGKGAYIAAGSSITRDVPEGSLGIARSRQVNKEGWARIRGKLLG